MCREWIKAARYHLIPCIEVHTGNYDKALSALMSPRSRLANSVTALKIGLSLYDASNTGHTQLENSLGLMKHLPLLKTLTLSYIGVWPMTLVQFHAEGSRISKLVLSNCYFSPEQHPFRIFPLFPAVKELTCTSLWPGDSSYIAYQLPSSLKKLHLDFVSLKALSSFGVLQNYPNLEVLTIECISFDTSDVVTRSMINQLFKHAGQTLKHISIVSETVAGKHKYLSHPCLRSS